jgi:hypothetical protein
MITKFIALSSRNTKISIHVQGTFVHVGAGPFRRGRKSISLQRPVHDVQSPRCNQNTRVNPEFALLWAPSTM